MSRPTPFRRSGHRNAKRVGAVASIAALAVTGLGVTPAQSVPVDPSCPEAIPTSELAPGDLVDGLTVDQGTTPEEFNGEVIGVLEDGIATDLDMVIVDLEGSPAIDEAGGIWQGMSGSPVYSDDGRLIGAVAYGLSWGSSPIAGVTPAEDMMELLEEGAPVRAAKNVKIPADMQRKMVRSGAVSRNEADTSMRQLKIPFSVPQVAGPAKRQKKVTKLFKNKDLRMVRTGAKGPGDPAPASEIMAGGNIAASISYGDVTAAGLGTTTAVCPEGVLAFGHPFNFDGPTSLTMHTASALYVQPDSLGAPFKVGNLTGAAGGFDFDGLAGIKGQTGDLPDTSVITTDYAVDGNQRNGQTDVSVPEWFGDITLSHVISNIDRLYNGYGEGSGSFDYTLEGTREDGTPFSLTREDVYADEFDISFALAYDLYEVMSTLQYRAGEEIEFTALDSTADLSHEYAGYEISKLERKVGGEWTKVKARRETVKVSPGASEKFRATLTSDDLDSTVVNFPIEVPDNAQRYGYAEVTGGNSSGGGGYYFEYRKADGTKLDKLLAKLEAAPHNDEVVVNSAFMTKGKGRDKKSQTQHPVGEVVDGYFGISFRVKN